MLALEYVKLGLEAVPKHLSAVHKGREAVVPRFSVLSEDPVDANIDTAPVDAIIGMASVDADIDVAPVDAGLVIDVRLYEAIDVQSVHLGYELPGDEVLGDSALKRCALLLEVDRAQIAQVTVLAIRQYLDGCCHRATQVPSMF